MFTELRKVLSIWLSGCIKKEPNHCESEMQGDSEDTTLNLACTKSYQTGEGDSRQSKGKGIQNRMAMIWNPEWSHTTGT